MSTRGRRVPWFPVLAALVAFAFIAIPLIGLVQSVPWTSLWGDLREPQATAALRLSIVCSLWAMLLSKKNALGKWAKWPAAAAPSFS